MSARDDEIDKMIRRNMYVRKDRLPDGRVVDVPGVNVPMPGRQFERKRGCWNCLHFNQGEAFRKHYRHCSRRDRKVYQERGLSAGDVGPRMKQLRLAILDSGNFGLCMRKEERTDSAAGDDFTHHGYLCDRWDGRIVIPASEGPVDPLPDELWDKIGEKPPGRS